MNIFLYFQVRWFSQQILKRRSKRDFRELEHPREIRVKLNDPRWPQMWYLVSTVF